MELPKNIIQVGEVNHSCKIYVEDYVISYIKQVNSHARDKSMAVAMYGVRREEAGVSYLFFYGACRLNFLTRESRHLSQAVQQEAEELRQKFFMQYEFLGYCMLNGEMVEGFQVCQQGVCRYIAGYAQFYEKNDCMLAFMVENRREEAKPEEVNQEKYDEVKKRQEERRLQSEEQGGQTLLRRWVRKPDLQDGAKNLRNMRYAAAAVFVLLCVAGFAGMNGGLEDLQVAARQVLENVNTQQLPDATEVGNNSDYAGTIVAEDKLTDAIQQENMAGAAAMEVQAAGSSDVTVPTHEPDISPTETSSPDPTVEPTIEPTLEPTVEPTPEPTAEPVSYTVQRGDTLIGICIAKYGSDEKVAEICSFNNITNPDDIKVGQKILLP